MQRPVPFKINALTRLRAANVPISEIIDVGVREETDELIAVFPELHHHLFEPVSTFFPDIAKNYARVTHTLHRLALSDENSQVFLVESSLLGDGNVTHSQIVAEPKTPDGKQVVACTPVAVRRFDDLGITPKKNYLLKVDVDGLDLRVLKGFGSKIKDASVVIVEATHSTLFWRMEPLVKAGFQLFDIVDQTYYGNGLYQMDVIMLRQDLYTDMVQPPMRPFQTDAWPPLIDTFKRLSGV